ncbi:MAG: hypothetical protein CMC93_01805 [Flavobacteriaceae bacterium]|nr:hypothetical protein [Flavobacteriaceae bacterium]
MKNLGIDIYTQKKACIFSMAKYRNHSSTVASSIKPSFDFEIFGFSFDNGQAADLMVSSNYN